MATKILFVSADNLVRADGLKSAATGGGYLNAAAVTMTLKNSLGAVVSGASGLNLVYVAASNGRYEGTIPSTVPLVAGQSYTLEVTAVEGSLDDFRVLACLAKNRGDV